MRGHRNISVQIPDELHERLMAEVGRRLIDKRPNTKIRHVVIEALEANIPALPKKGKRS